MRRKTLGAIQRRDVSECFTEIFGEGAPLTETTRRDSVWRQGNNGLYTIGSLASSPEEMDDVTSL